MINKILKNKYIPVIAVLLSVMIGFYCMLPAVFAADVVETYDCPNCSDGSYSVDTNSDCPACDNGIVMAEQTSVCDICNGSGESSENCPMCTGDGYYIETLRGPGTASNLIAGYVLHGCENCGGEHLSAKIDYSDLDYSAITYGSGKAPCPHCEDGYLYTEVPVDCSICDGEGVLYSTDSYSCPTCNGSAFLQRGFENLSVLSDISMMDKTSMLAEFDFDIVGEVGTIEYIWYVNNIPLATTTQPSWVLSGFKAGEYEIYCNIASSCGLDCDTNVFNVSVLAFDSGSDSDFNLGDFDSDGLSNVIVIVIVIVIILLLLVCVYLYIKRS